MLSPLTHDSTPPKGGQERENRLSNHGDSVGTLITTSRYHQNLACPTDLSLA
jgi:hypothetical protein